MSVKVFVYGSLRQGMGANHLMGKDTFVCRAIAPLRGCLISNGAWPAVVLGDRGEVNPTSMVVGEVYEVPNNTIDTLNAYEGYPHLFGNVNIHAYNTDTGYRHTCMMYNFNPDIDYDNNYVVNSGDWVEFSENPVKTMTYGDLVANNDLIQEHMRCSWESIETLVTNKDMQNYFKQRLLDAGFRPNGEPAQDEVPAEPNINPLRARWQELAMRAQEEGFVVPRHRNAEEEEF